MDLIMTTSGVYVPSSVSLAGYTFTTTQYALGASAVAAGGGIAAGNLSIGIGSTTGAFFGGVSNNASAISSGLSSLGGYQGATGAYESHWLLRTFVPGQVYWDQALTAFGQGDYLGAGINTVGMVGEQAFTALTAGQSGYLSPELRWLENARGYELTITKDLRIGWHRLPTKDFPGAGRNLPHGHWRPGIGKHRPWETLFKQIQDWWGL